MLEIPKILLDEIRSGNVVLFLGAGASFDAVHNQGKTVPMGKTLGKMIAEKFLDSSYFDNDLTYISEVAIAQKSLYDVQFYVKDIFSDFTPGEHHLLIPTFHGKVSLQPITT